MNANTIPPNGRSGGYGIVLKIMPPIMGTSGKSIAARPKNTNRNYPKQ
jgi:hypothetical protein